MKDKITAKIGKFIDDITTLDVLTLSGTIALKPDPKPEDGAPAGAGVKELKWDDYFKDVVAKLKTPDADTKLEIVAYTHTELDADSVNFYRTAGTEDALRDLHLRTVESATKARLDAVAAFARVFK
jgi:hypothetical protein